MHVGEGEWFERFVWVVRTLKAFTWIVLDGSVTLLAESTGIGGAREEREMTDAIKFRCGLVRFKVSSVYCRSRTGMHVFSSQ